MIAIVSDASIVYGPAAYSVADIKRVLFSHGFSLSGEVWRAPDGTEIVLGEGVCLSMGSGFRCLPVVESSESAPEGKALSGLAPVVMADHVELRPVWTDLPALDALKASALKEIRTASEAVRAAYYPTGKEIDIRRLAPGYSQGHLDVLNGFLDGTLNPVSFQAALEIEAAGGASELQEIMAEYRALYGQELA